MLNIISIIIYSYIPHLGYVNTEFSNKYMFSYNGLLFKNGHTAYNWRIENLRSYGYNGIHTSKGDHMIRTNYILPLRLIQNDF